MSLTLREIKLLKQRRKKSGPPCGVDFKRELTSSVLTSRGFHCIANYLLLSNETNLMKDNKSNLTYNLSSRPETENKILPCQICRLRPFFVLILHSIQVVRLRFLKSFLFNIIPSRLRDKLL